MSACQICHKGVRKISISRHKKGASGASKWPMRAQISKRLQKPNLHAYKGMRLCTKCLRMIKKSVQAKKEETIKTSVIPSA